MRFQTAILAIFAAAQLGWAAPASGAGDGTHHLEARDRRSECEKKCFAEKRAQYKVTTLTISQKADCYSRFDGTSDGRQ
ncbi:hypothetical protein MCOR27_008384 [Pyricularia oryzae]|uniref:Uncharacterized protein n=2 Tax=Pyricularia TaxID=48558 RepID=A0ABQ8NB46_PYRGI|nr:hypothetical protein MCOR01_009987 [Pyricularia oryzae]KAI6293815.1 hypothetical protein MCOR33_008887 [Pyricularia grisea]KAH9436698.1 hypothetical protein MCOR02_000367 [Pyricularia oryzae]KAI6258988.1 hypothetical protein MCOR19_004642 [Pyricularia oryzae]KAI6272319.1 hypothetical protein MCOR27_008384 [Pyricularia oryzae]